MNKKKIFSLAKDNNTNVGERELVRRPCASPKFSIEIIDHWSILIQTQRIMVKGSLLQSLSLLSIDLSQVVLSATSPKIVLSLKRTLLIHGYSHVLEE